MKSLFESNVESSIRNEICNVLQKCGFPKNVRIKIGEKAELKEQNDEFIISLTETVINSPAFAVSQLKSLLLKSNDNLLSIFEIETKKNFFWEYIPELERHLAIKESVMSPVALSSKLFLHLIKEKKDLFKGKKVLDLGTGTGILAIELARYGAKVIAIDINPEAIENIKLNILLEDSDIRNLIVVGISDLYKNIYEITNREQVFDYIFFNAPLLSSSNPNINDTNSFTDSNFQTSIQAIQELPKVLNKNGRAYFLVCESQIKLKDVWTLSHIEEILPTNFRYKLTDFSVELYKELGLAFSVIEIYLSKV